MINKFDMQQDIERVLVSEEDIHARIREVGAQISEDYCGKCPILGLSRIHIWRHSPPAQAS